MPIKSDQIKKVANLAKLPLSSEEESVYASQLEDIVGYIDQIDKVDVSSVEPTFNITLNKNNTQKDSVSKSLTQQEALSNAAEKKEGLFKAYGVFNNE